MPRHPMHKRTKKRNTHLASAPHGENTLPVRSKPTRGRPKLIRKNENVDLKRVAKVRTR